MSESSQSLARQRLASINDEISKLQAEAVEIESALAVLSRYDVGGTPVAQTATNESPSLDTNPTKRRDRVLTGPPRPEGIPSIWDMTNEALIEAPNNQLTVDELLDLISARWWPGVVRNQIAPQVYKFAKDGRLEKVDKGVFALPRESATVEAEKPRAEHANDMFGPQNPNQGSVGQ